MSHMTRIESRIATTERAKLRKLRDEAAQRAENWEQKTRRDRAERAILRAEVAEWAPQWRHFVK